MLRSQPNDSYGNLVLIIKPHFKIKTDFVTLSVLTLGKYKRLERMRKNELS